MKQKQLTTEEAFTRIKEGAIAYVGCEHGSGFIFIGSLQEYEKMIDHLTNQYLQLYKKRVKTRQQRLKFLSSELERLQDQLHTQKPKGNARTELKRKISEITAEIPFTEKSLQHWKEAVANFTSFRSRTVIDAYSKGICEENGMPGIAIIISGEDNGQFWMYEETPWYAMKHD